MTQSYFNELGIVCAAGTNKSTMVEALFNAEPFTSITRRAVAGKSVPIASVSADLAEIPVDLEPYRCRNNQLLLTALRQLQPSIESIKARFGPERLGVVVGTSTSGIAVGEEAVDYHWRHGHLPTDYQYKRQELGCASEFVAQVTGAEGPAYTVSTSCSSSANALLSAQRLLDCGYCDAVITGGADALCNTTLGGFSALQAISQDRCNPFSRNRDGIVIGEGAALFILSREPGPVALLGTGASADAYHISAPDPSGEGARLAMSSALRDAGLKDPQIDYINLHGTGTPQNDAMESKAVFGLFGDRVPCSSTKPLTGHCLGAAGAIELGICWLLLSGLSRQGYDRCLPPHLWDRQRDPQLATLQLVDSGERYGHPQICMSNTYAFGGNNVSLIIGATQ